MLTLETSTTFSEKELATVVANCIISKLFLTYPSAFSALAGSGSVVLALATVLAGGLMVALTVKLYGKSRKGITDFIKGKTKKATFTAVAILLFTVNLALFTRSVSESIKISLLPQAPLWFVTLIFTVGILLFALTGLKATVRAHSFILPLTLAGVIVLLLSSAENFDIYNIFPLFGKGGVMFTYLWLLCSYFSDLFVLMFLMPFASNKVTFKGVAVKSYIISSAVLVAVILTYTLALPYGSWDGIFIPVYRIAQFINFKSFLSRLESVFCSMWLLSFYGNGATYLYLASMLTGRLTGAKSNRPAMCILTALITLLSFIPQSTSQLVQWANFYSVPKLVIGILLPWIIFTAGRVKK